MTDPSLRRRRAALVGGLTWVLVVVGLLAAPPLRNVDWGWQLQTGERILTERTVYLPDTFTVAGAGRSIPPIHWLYEVGLALAHRVVGLNGLVFLRTAVAWTLYGLLFAVATRQGMPPIVAAATTSVAATASWVQLVLRPQMVSFTFTVVLVGLLLEARRRPRWLLPIPFLFVLWANLHPGAILGLGVLGAFSAGEILRRVAGPFWRGEKGADAGRLFSTYAVLVLASALATCASPSGTDLWTWMWDHRSLFERYPIGELAPLDLSAALDRFNLAVAAALLCLGGLRLWRDPACWLAAAFFAVLTASASRFSPYVQHLLVLAVAVTWGGAVHQPAWRWARNGIVAVLAVIAGWGALNAARSPHPMLHSFSHVPGAADFLVAQATPEPLYNSQQIGGYLIYRLAGQRKVFWSGRPTLFQDLWGLDWPALDERFAFGTLVFADGDRPHAADLPGGEQRWRLAYFDDHARIYIDVAAAKAGWSERGFRNVRLRWSRSQRHAGLVPVIEDPRAALSELAPQQARDPDGYYTNLALARAQLELGQLDAAHESAKRALARRDSPIARSVLGAPR